MVLPEKMSCLDVDHNASWCAAGAPSGRVYLWELASGSLFKSFAAHYRGITVLRFHSDGQTFVTGGDDSVISIWSIPRIVDYESEAEIPTPIHTLTDHTLPISALCLGVGPLTSARIFSASLDGTVKVWCIDSHTSSDASGPSSTLLATFTFAVPVVELVVDPLERFLFAAMSGDQGEIKLIRMYTEKEGDTASKSLANGILGEIHTDAGTPAKMIITGAKVTALALTSTARLLVGTIQGHINIYDTTSLQLIKTIHTSQSSSPLPITFISTLSKPVDLVGHAQLHVNGTQHDETAPIRPVMPIARSRDTKGKDREVSLMLPKQPNTSYIKYDPLEDHAAFCTPAALPLSGAKADLEDSEARASRLEAEVGTLREMLDKAKSINDAMWEKMLQQTAAQARSPV